MIDEATRLGVKEAFNMTDSDSRKIPDYLGPFFHRFPEFEKTTIIAEVIESKYCAMGLKVGDKVVIKRGGIDKEETTCPLCLRAIGPLTTFCTMIMNAISQGVDPNTNCFQTAGCLDPGIGRGGLGHVVFKIYTEPVG